MITLRQHLHDILELFFVRRRKKYGNPEPGHQGKLFLHRIPRMQLFPLQIINLNGRLPLLLIGKLLPYQMPPVGGCIDQHVVRLFLKTALNHCL